MGNCGGNISGLLLISLHQQEVFLYMTLSGMLSSKEPDLLYLLMDFIPPLTHAGGILKSLR